MRISDWSSDVCSSDLIAAAVLAPPAMMFGLHDYQRKRILTFLNPEADPSGSGYHILQSKIALGSGGLLGKGYGLGSQSQRIGRASCRGSVCQYVYITVAAVALNKKQNLTVTKE